MIIWLNGAFGAGKTQCAYELNRRISNSYVYDPENVGYFMWKNVPPTMNDRGKDDFQDIPLWRSFNLELISYIRESYDGTIIIPMTVTNRDYYDELIGGLEQKYDLHHYILYAERKTIKKRLRKRLENENRWAFKQIDRCITAFDTVIPGVKIHTDSLTIAETAELIAQKSGIKLNEDNRPRIFKEIDRIITQIRHIR